MFNEIEGVSVWVYLKRKSGGDTKWSVECGGGDTHKYKIDIKRVENRTGC